MECDLSDTEALSDFEPEEDAYFFQLPSERLSCLEDDKLWHLFQTMEAFFDDNLLPRTQLTYATFCDWMTNNDDNQLMCLDTLHVDMSMSSVYDKTIKQLTFFVLRTAIESARTKPCWRA